MRQVKILRPALSQGFHAFQSLAPALGPSRAPLPTNNIKKYANPGGTFSVQIGVHIDGAGGGGRTHTVSPPRDFESRTSANSITPAYWCII